MRAAAPSILRYLSQPFIFLMRLAMISQISQIMNRWSIMTIMDQRFIRKYEAEPMSATGMSETNQESFLCLLLSFSIKLKRWKRLVR